jgi:GR25 family glycosyltransferase involved in LPS biosynthesis
MTVKGSKALQDIFFITIQGMQRTPFQTRSLLESMSQEWAVHELGVDLRKSDLVGTASVIELKKLAFITGGQLSPGEIGCYMSHQLVYETMVRQEISQALVLEDDANIVGSLSDLKEQLAHCKESDFDLVSFYGQGGAIYLRNRTNTIYSALVPPVSTLAYWISLRGAKILQTERQITGTADWPLQIAKVKVGAIKLKLIEHSEGLQSIDEFSDSNRPQNRVHLSVRPIKVLLAQFRRDDYSYLLTNFGVFVTFKQLLFYRVIKKFTKLVKYSHVHENGSVVLWR